MEAYMVCLLVALLACFVAITLLIRNRRKQKWEEECKTNWAAIEPPHSIRN